MNNMKVYIYSIILSLLISCYSNDVDKNLLSDNVNKNLLSFVLLKNNIKKWEKGIIKYKFFGMSKEQECSVRLAMDDWQYKTDYSIKFIESENYELTISNGNTSSSCSDGHNSALNMVVFDNYDYRTLRHELGHVIGLTHEHQRPDRDEYIVIHFENIILTDSFQFVKKNSPLYNYKNYDYDFKSIMHYYNNSATKNGLNTIESLSPIGSDQISEIDAQKVKDIYKK